MRVCHIISGDLWAGPEVQTCALLTSLQSQPDLTLYAIVLNEGKLADSLNKAGISVTVINESKHHFVSILKRIRCELDRRRVDILHSHRYKENLLAALVKKRCNIKYLVQTIHGIQERYSGLKWPKIKLYGCFNDYVTRKYFDRLFPVSHEIAQELSQRFDPARMVTIHNAINIADLKTTRSVADVRNEFGIDKNYDIIGTAGRMVPIKGFDVLLRAAKLILEKKTTVCLLLAGDGSQKTELEQKAETMGLTGKVRFVGFRDDIVDFINCLDIFVMTSYHEGVPLILLEAMAMQKPVVATSVGGINEVIENNVSGLLVEPGDEKAFASACLGLLNDSEWRKRLSVASKVRVEEEFTVEKQMKRVLSQYNLLMEHG